MVFCCVVVLLVCNAACCCVAVLLLCCCGCVCGMLKCCRCDVAVLSLCCSVALQCRGAVVVLFGCGVVFLMRCYVCGDVLW